MRGQTTVEFMAILVLAALILLITVTTASGQGRALSANRAGLEASLAATSTANAAREAHAQGIGARRIFFITLPDSYDASASGVYPSYLSIRAEDTDFVETFPFQVSGSLPSGPGSFEILVENNGNTVSIGRRVASANTSAIDATLYAGENYSAAVLVSGFSGYDANVTVQCAWDDGDVNISCPDAGFAVAAKSNGTFTVGFSASADAAYGTYSGLIGVAVQAVEANQSIWIPASISVVPAP